MKPETKILCALTAACFVGALFFYLGACCLDRWVGEPHHDTAEMTAEEIQHAEEEHAIHLGVYQYLSGFLSITCGIGTVVGLGMLFLTIGVYEKEDPSAEPAAAH